MVAIKVYVEGGGDGFALRTACRRGFSKLFERARLAGRMPRVIACGNRARTFEDFSTAVRHAEPGEFVRLLVDSENSVADNTSPWVFLRHADQWVQPDGTSDDHAHLMVQCMEAWFLADPNAIERFFGQGFRRNALPRRADVEKIPKRDVLAALAGATSGSATKGPYRKGRLSFELLATLDPEKVAASPYAGRLFRTLRCRAQGPMA